MTPSAAHCDPEPAAVPRDPAPRNGPARIALIGNPNTGKTTVFNRLCGTRAKTSNFPGTTTTARVGRAMVGGDTLVDVVDLPGLYQLGLDVPEAQIARDVLSGTGLFTRPDAVLVVVDACNLTRNLVLVGELLSYQVPVVVALNMIDLAQARGLTFEPERMELHLGCPVLPVVARRGDGLDAVRIALGEAVHHGVAPAPAALLTAEGTSPDLVAWADDVVEDSVGGHAAVGSGSDTLTERLDKAFTHPVVGLATFIAVMVGLFWTLFWLATVPMDLIEAVFTTLGDLAARILPTGLVHDLVSQGIIGGIAGTVVFLPQICLLFFLISLLEDTGYLARAAFVMDRVLCRFGLPGHAFVPPDPYPNYWYPGATFFAGAVTGAIWAAAVDWDDWGVWGGDWDGGDIDIDCNDCFNNRDFNGKIDFNDVDWKNIDRDKINIDRDQLNKLDRTNVKNRIEKNGDNAIRDRAKDIKKRDNIANKRPGAGGAGTKDIRQSTLDGLKGQGGQAGNRPGNRPDAGNRPNAGDRPANRPSANRPAGKPANLNRPAGKPKPAARADNRPKKPSGLGDVNRGKTSKVNSNRGHKSMGGGSRGGGGHKQIRRPSGGGGGGRGGGRGGGGGRRR